jgi:hypothetical protein
MFSCQIGHLVIDCVTNLQIPCTFQSMKPDQKTLDEFKSIYKEEFEEELDDEEAYDRFSRLINVMRILTSKDKDSK